MTEKVISDEIMQALLGVIPTAIGSCSVSGIPNVTYTSQVYYVDESHVALSYQLFNKTRRNVLENPVLCAIVINPIKYSSYKLKLRFIEEQRSGPIFDEIESQLDAISSVFKKPGSFPLLAADIYEVLSIEKIA